MNYQKLKQLIENLDADQIYQVVDIRTEDGKRYRALYLDVDPDTGEVILRID